MKRLLVLLPLLLATAQAGNLGAADEVMFGVDAKTPDYSQTSFKVHVGHMAGRGTDKSMPLSLMGNSGSSPTLSGSTNFGKRDA